MGDGLGFNGEASRSRIVKKQAEAVWPEACLVSHQKVPFAFRKVGLEPKGPKNTGCTEPVKADHITGSRDQIHLFPVYEPIRPQPLALQRSR